MATNRGPAGQRRRREALKREQIIAEMAAHIRRLYVNHRRAAQSLISGEPCTWGERWIPKWDGGLDRHDVNHQPIWPKIALHLLEMKVSPELVVGAMFQDVGKDMPQPNALIRWATPHRIAEARAQAAASIHAAFRYQKQVFAAKVDHLVRTRGMSKGVAAIRVLTSPDIPLSGLWRFCVARSAGDEATAEVYRKPALWQYAFFMEEYDAAWGDFIPADLREEATELVEGGSDG
jgi:hypothetical protein